MKTRARSAEKSSEHVRATAARFRNAERKPCVVRGKGKELKAASEGCRRKRGFQTGKKFKIEGNGGADGCWQKRRPVITGHGEGSEKKAALCA